MRPIRVVIADDHAIVRMTLALLLAEEDDVEVVGQAADGAEAVERARELSPDVLIMDVNMPRMNGIEATRKIASGCPSVKVIGLSMHTTDTLAKEMLQAGAVGYVPKGTPVRDLLDAIHAVQ